MADPILDDISHRRFNPLRGSWILVSPHRTKRPWQGQQEPPAKTTLPEYDPSCYLCPGNKRAQGDVNPQYQDTFVFVNDFSAVKEQQQDYTSSKQDGSLASRLLQVEPVTGKCYVITFSRAHNQTLADLFPPEIVPVIETWTKIYQSHLSPTSSLTSTMLPTNNDLDTSSLSVSPPSAQYRYMQIFENKGAAMGCSNPHPHGQVWTTTGLPEEPALELAQLQAYRREHNGSHMLVDYATLEANDGTRTVFENSAFIALCPWWATWPFEVLVLPKSHKRALPDLSAQDRLSLAEALAEVTRRYDNLFETMFPYSMGLHQAPLQELSTEETEASSFHIHFYPPLLRSASVRKFLVGYELLAEPQRDITPEQAAARLRACGGELYRRRLQPDG